MKYLKWLFYFFLACIVVVILYRIVLFIGISMLPDSAFPD
jgi:hypothetical protein